MTHYFIPLLTLTHSYRELHTMIESIDITTDTIEKMYKLAEVPLLLSSHRNLWESFGWKYESSVGDEFGFKVDVPGGFPLSVDPLGQEIVSTSLPFCYWEGFFDNSHSDIEEFEKEKLQYDTSFDNSLELAKSVLGNPKCDWRDDDMDHHRAAIWHTDESVFVIQQACFDPQFGIELNIWIQAFDNNGFSPTSPLIDYLSNYSAERHSKLGFPALLW